MNDRMFLCLLAIAAVGGCTLNHQKLAEQRLPESATTVRWYGEPAVNDTLAFRYALATSASGAAWQCGTADAILSFHGSHRVSGAYAYWKTVPDGARFQVTAVTKVSDRWSCAILKPLAP